jgi:peptide/nickel transport system ATP-binding protein
VTAPPTDAVLSVRNLNIRFTVDKQSRSIVEAASFTLGAGELVGLVGESGCGKSVTGAALLGMVSGPGVRVEADQLQLAGVDLNALDEAGWRRVRGSQVSLIFQEPLTALDPVFTIGSQLTEVIRRHRRCRRGTARELAADALIAVGLADSGRILRSYPHELSGGMRQRVMIAMAMSCKPRVLVADEPTTALDVTTQAQILLQLRELARATGTAVLLISHDLGVVAQACDRALVMYCGQIVEEGPVEVLFSRPRHPYTAGLLAALPVLTQGPPRPVVAIPGSVPSLAQLPSGCRFNNRCAHALALCHEQAPSLQPGRPESPSGRYACHYPLPEAERQPGVPVG